MAYGDPQLLHVDRMLTQVSVGYQNEELVGDNLFPAVRVDNQSDRYWVMDKYGFTVIDDIRGPNARTNEMPPMTLSLDTYFAEEHALKDWVPIEEQGNADSPLTPLADAAERVSDTILINREDKIQTFARTAANYATGHTVTLSGTAQWNDYTNSVPLTNLKTARDAIHLDALRMPNMAIIGYEVATYLEDHPKFLDRIKANPNVQSIDMQLNLIGQLAGIPTLFRAGAVKNTANIGQPQTFGYMWGKDVVVAYVPNAPGKKVPAYGYEYVWPLEGATMPTDRWYDDDRKSTAVRTTRRYDLKLAAVDSVASGKSIAGYLIKAAVA